MNKSNKSNKQKLQVFSTNSTENATFNDLKPPHYSSDLQDRSRLTHQGPHELHQVCLSYNT